MTPLLAAAGHEVVGLDTGLFRSFTLGEMPDVPTLDQDLRDVERRRPRGLRRRHPPRRDLQRPGRQPRPRADLRRSTTTRACGSPRPPSRRDVARFLYSSSCSTYGAAEGETAVDERSDVQPRHALRPLQGAGRARHRAARRRRLQPRLPAQRDRLRRLPPPARRHRDQQPRRLRLRDRRGADAERRLAVAPVRPHRGHLARLPGRARGAARGDPQRGLQHRPRRGQPPDPRRRAR